MSVRLPAPSQDAPQPPKEDVSDASSHSSASDSEDDDNEETWDDWVSDSNKNLETKALFDDQVFPSVSDALAHDKQTHGFSLDETCKRLELDFHGRVRLINYIRKKKPAPQDVAAFQKDADWLKSDEYLLPAIENDPLLQMESDDWSDSDDEGEQESASSAPADIHRKVKKLERRLKLAQQSLADYRLMMAQKLELTDAIKDASVPEKITQLARDDDTHYFESYAENDIHAVMIRDKVRTSTYAQFILTHPNLFTNATVLDVGCGTGILSLFAARAGAKKVIAVDASDIALKAQRVIKANNMQDTITVIHSKVEDIKELPEGIQEVDIIISEWMGYALLYESMLDSVLVARDRWLKKGGVMAPSECRMMLGLSDATEVYKERIGFWDDVYGFDMSVMSEKLYDEAIIDVLGPETLYSEPYTVKDLLLGNITTSSLNFSSPFTLVSTTPRRRSINSFILYFDTFFHPLGDPVPEGMEAKCVKEGEVVVAELWPVGGKPAQKRRQSVGASQGVNAAALGITSFSTGPRSVPTHWKQTLFMLREPIVVSEGSIVTGNFSCIKSETNSRELDVEIRYSVRDSEDASPSETIVQFFKVR